MTEHSILFLYGYFQAIIDTIEKNKDNNYRLKIKILEKLKFNINILSEEKIEKLFKILEGKE